MQWPCIILIVTVILKYWKDERNIFILKMPCHSYKFPSAIGGNAVFKTQNIRFFGSLIIAGRIIAQRY